LNVSFLLIENIYSNKFCLALPAIFTKYLPKTWTVYGDEPLELSCQLSKGNVRVIWLRDGIPIDDKNQIKNEGLRYSLYIPHGIQPGRYTIRIDDNNGQESSCQVSVEGMKMIFSRINIFIFLIRFSGK
jgi:membrane carboxypeptidase/penicillin-binding protein PbpC